MTQTPATATDPVRRAPPTGAPTSCADAGVLAASRAGETRDATRRLIQRGARRLRNLLAHWDRVATDERLRSVAVTYGRLDYPAAEIHLRLSSRQEFHRLGSCRKEPWTVRWIEQYLQPGEVLYDVGANVGAYTLLAAVVPGARVVSFEPGPANFAALCANIELNAVADHVTTIPIALGDHPHQVRLGHNPDVPGSAPRPVDAGSGEAATSVLVDRLDDVVERFGLSAPQHLKLDVDGAEAKVLDGADRILASDSLRSVMVELHDGRDGEAAERLRRHGFELLEETTSRGRAVSAPTYGLFVRPDA